MVACIRFWRQRVHFFPNTPVSLRSRTRSDQVLEAKLMQHETEQFDFVFYWVCTGTEETAELMVPKQEQ